MMMLFHQDLTGAAHEAMGDFMLHSTQSIALQMVNDAGMLSTRSSFEACIPTALVLIICPTLHAHDRR